MASATPPDRRSIVISGPSGVGKGTLCQKFIDAYPNTFAFSVSHITREPRAGETEGINYFNVSQSTFSPFISEDVFVEYTFFNGNYYGTSKKAIADQAAKGLVVVLDIEMEGVKQMKEHSFDARYVFIKLPSFEALETRLRNRGSEKEENIQERLAQARVELEYANMPGAHDKIIVNDDLDKACAELVEFVYKPVS